MNPYQDTLVDAICGDIKKAHDNNIIGGSVILVFSAIDAMAFLSMPLGQKEVHRRNYVQWVEKYMKTDQEQEYQYCGVDFYGARCGIIHRYGVKSRLSESGQCKIFAYHNGTDHKYNPNVDKTLVLISTKRLVNDFFSAVKSFLDNMSTDVTLKSKVDSRIFELFIISKRKRAFGKRVLNFKRLGT